MLHHYAIIESVIHLIRSYILIDKFSNEASDWLYERVIE